MSTPDLEKLAEAMSEEHWPYEDILAALQRAVVDSERDAKNHRSNCIFWHERAQKLAAQLEDMTQYALKLDDWNDKLIAQLAAAKEDTGRLDVLQSIELQSEWNTIFGRFVDEKDLRAVIDVISPGGPVQPNNENEKVN